MVLKQMSSLHLHQGDQEDLTQRMKTQEVLGLLVDPMSEEVHRYLIAHILKERNDMVVCVNRTECKKQVDSRTGSSLLKRLIANNVDPLLVTDVAMAPLEALASGQITLQDAMSVRAIQELVAKEVLDFYSQY